MSGDSVKACDDRLAPDAHLPDRPGADGAPTSPDRIERIRQIFRNISFDLPTGGHQAKWPSSDSVLGGGAEELLLDAAAIGDSLSSLPSLPMAVMDLLKATDSDTISIDALAAKIEVDQGLVVRLLRVVNSAFYGLERKVSSVPDAIIVLGTGNVHNLVLTVSLSDYVTGTFSVRGIHFPTFWKHSIAVAICARALAPRMRCNGNSAFTAGLLHDMGRLALAMHYPSHMAEVGRYQQHVDCYFHEAEKEVLGIDHAGIGHLMAERWNFPEGLCAAILGHHDPESVARTPLGCVVHIADAMVHALEMAGNDRKQLPRIFAPCWHTASLSWADCQAVLAEVDQGLENFAHSLEGMGTDRWDISR